MLFFICIFLKTKKSVSLQFQIKISSVTQSTIRIRRNQKYNYSCNKTNNFNKANKANKTNKSNKTNKTNKSNKTNKTNNSMVATMSSNSNGQSSRRQMATQFPSRITSTRSWASIMTSTLSMIRRVTCTSQLGS